MGQGVGDRVSGDAALMSGAYFYIPALFSLIKLTISCVVISAVIHGISSRGDFPFFSLFIGRIL